MHADIWLGGTRPRCPLLSRVWGGVLLGVSSIELHTSPLNGTADLHETGSGLLCG